MEPLVYGLCIWLLLQLSQQSETSMENRRHLREFIEDKLIEHGQALEQILRALQRNEELTKRLIDNMSLRLSPPKLPERIEQPILSRRNEPVVVHPELMKVGVKRPIAPAPKPLVYASDKVDPWCRNAVQCKNTSKDPICGFDETFGYAKFDNICHLIYVNCFWRHNFTIVPECHLKNGKYDFYRLK